jgi:uncharacterized protein YfaS (alpha-2-macroglobulin family)
MRRLGLAAALVLVSASGALAAAEKASAPVVIPDHFLRRWDPVTVFFGHDVGPSGGGPEDHPERVVTLAPAHPGAFRWVDAHTLQFRPAEPWPSLARFTFTAEGRGLTLTTLMDAPVETLPADGAEGLDPVDEVALTFPEPVDTAALERMASIELRPLPGVGSGGARWLTRADFEVKTVERRSRQDRAAYVLALRTPIPVGTRAVVHLRLSLEDRDQASFREIAFSTAEPFRVVEIGCRDKQYPVTSDGTRYTKDQAIRCASGRRTVVVSFSASPKAFGPVEGRNLVRFTPAVPKLEFNLQGKTLEVSGEFAWETLYAVSLAPAPVADDKGRRLDLRGGSEVFLFFPRRPAYVRWGASQGVVERLGPQTVPVEGRGQERLDLRIHRVDPLDRSFWPFPDQPVVVDESKRPPGPGEEPEAHAVAQPISPFELGRHLATLGSPPVSALVDLPLRRDGGSASFGLDLAAHLARIAPKGQPGTYLVGLRDVSGPSQRAWIRIQATDLSLSTVEEPKAVRFVVTSLSTGLPVAGARVRVEGDQGHSTWQTLGEGTTDLEGGFLWKAPGRQPPGWNVRRLVVEKDGDVLVLDPTRAPERYADNQWSESRGTWLQWAVESLQDRGPQPETLCHIFTERPVYRPEEEVHIKGYLRKRERGRLTPVAMPGFLVVEGPGDLAWKYPVTLGEGGSFYHKFTESQLPTGVYHAHLEDAKRENRYGEVSFRMEAYRIPRFEVRLHTPDRTPLDRAFQVSLTASYYAGGRVTGQPVQWRVTQFPYAWSPKRLDGYQYSSDARFSGQERFASTPRLEKGDKTDDTGGASLSLDPTIEPTAQPRSYVVEATVTGADDQTVTATRRVLALPPFVLGLKAPRFLERAKQIDAGVIVVGSDGELMADTEVTVRLLRREWHSHLRASDFSDGVARYMTDVVDEKVMESKVKSGSSPLTVPLPIAKAGVYVVELEARDRLDRAQVVSMDLYAGGDEPVAWSKPVTSVFSVATDRPSYDPEQTAAMVLKSPFQTAHALAVVEAPEGNQYHWVSVEGGAATFHLPILGTFAPRVPVHFVLMRGRLPGTAPQPGNQTDLGKPATMAATAWLDVNPVDNQVGVKLAYPETARPGQTIEVTISLATPKGRPVPGEVTLWLVDQAVLALGKEQRLDPLPDFITKVGSHLAVHDTRNMAFGALPFAESPGGDEGEGSTSPLDRATVRKNFKSVPYYNPAITVGPDGTVKVSVTLSDDLTNFDLRAKAAAGAGSRFGYATGRVAVRLPVIVQPALPRFVRPGDRFVASAIGRIVEGQGGPGSAEMRAEGVRLTGAARREVDWAPDRPERLDFPVEVPTPALDAAGRPALGEVVFRVGVERASDKATDAFEARLPLRPDRETVTRRVLQDLKPGVPLALPALPEAARPGTVRRSVLVSDQPGLVRMAAGLDFLLAYPYGCTEQQTSRARAYIALKKFRTLLKQEGSDKEIDRAVRDTLQWIPTVVDPNGLAAYWPGSQGYVSLTAWVVQFLVEAKEAGFTVDDKLFARLVRSLQQALRSDYGHFIDGEAFTERAWALAALAQAGQFDSSYATELARRAQYLDVEGLAEVLQAFGRAKQTPETLDALQKQLWDGLIVRLYQGREIYGGLQERNATRNGLMLPSETRAVAEVTRALVRLQPKHPRLPVMVDALVTLGRDDGWGTTNANASALLALGEMLQPPFAGAGAHAVTVRFDGKDEVLSLGATAPVGSLTSASAGAGEVTLQAGGGAGAVVARAETAYVPAADGSQAAAQSQGFVVTRELARIDKAGAPPERIALSQAGATQTFDVGQVIEEHVQVVNPKERHYVAVVVPLAAGMEPLNPHLATAPPEAAPAGRNTRDATYVAFLDDQVAYYFDTLPAGTYDFYFRTRAQVPGSFIQPPAKAEMMYDGAVRGNGNGARIAIERRGQ